MIKIISAEITESPEMNGKMFLIDAHGTALIDPDSGINSQMRRVC